MGLQQRGGIPQQRNLTIDSTGRFVRFNSLTTNLTVKVNTAAVRIFFTALDFTNDTNFREIGVGEVFSEGIEMRGVWFKAVGADAELQITAIIRKG